MQRGSWLSRLTGWFSGAPRAPLGGTTAASSGSDRGVESGVERPEGLEEEAGDDTRALPALSRRRHREEAVARLEEGFGRVVQLCDALQTHFSNQEQRTAEIAGSLAETAAGVSRLTGVGERQNETLQAIVGQLEAGNHRSKRLEDLFNQFSKMTEAQRQALAVVSQQVDASRQADQRVVESLGVFQETIGALGRSCEASAVSLKDLHVAATQRDQRFSELMAQQNRRFIGLFVVTLILAAASIVGAALTWMLKAPP